MRKAGRSKDGIWQEFDELPSTSGKSGCRAKCKACGKELQGLVQRMKSHIQQCNMPSEVDEEDSEVIMMEPGKEIFIKLV